MSASAVRGGQVYVEIGANPSKLLNALRTVNTQVGSLGSVMSGLGTSMMTVGASIVGPIAGLGAVIASQSKEWEDAKRAVADVATAIGEAVAPAFVGLSKVVSGGARALAKFIKENQPLVRQIASVGVALVAIGAPMFAVGLGLSYLSKAASGFSSAIGPIVGNVLKFSGALVTIATSTPVLGFAAVLLGAGLAARAAGFDLGGLAKSLGASFAGPIASVQQLFGDLAATASTTVTGVYNAIAAGDLGGAVDIAWAGIQAAWARGEQAVMGALDPWIESIQNAFSDAGVWLAASWDQTWTDIATSDWGGYLLGALDNVLNGVMATWDQTIGYLQKGWAKFSAWWSGDTAKMQAEISRIDAANADNAAKRGRDRPGFAGRTGLTDEQKARMQQESSDRQAAMREAGQQMRDERRRRTVQNLSERAAAVGAANAQLQAQVAGTSAPPPVAIASQQMASSVVGQFGGAGLEQMGASSIPKQQLDELKRIREELAKAAASGGIVV